VLNTEHFRGEIRNVVLKKDGEQLDGSREKQYYVQSKKKETYYIK